VNGVEVLDDYLLDLLAEAAPSRADAEAASVGAAAVVGAASAATVDLPVTDTSVGAEAPPTTAACPSIAAPPTKVAAPVMAPDPERIAAELLAEMDADPAFAAKPSAPSAPPAPALEIDIDANVAAMLAEMDGDPAFAGKPVAAPAAPTLDIDATTAALLAEMDADPAFAAAKPAPVASAPAPAARPRSGTLIAPIARRTPPPRSRLPANIQAMFQPPPADPSPHRRAAERSTRWLRLRCGEQTYALELLKVQEVVLPVPLLPLRGTARSILGIMNLRGQVVPVLDLGVHLGAGPVNQDTNTRVVVLEENGETMGLRVSSVEDVTSLTDQQIEPPDTTRLCRISNHLFRGVARISSQPVILLDATYLLH